jgi:hypothetical protein
VHAGAAHGAGTTLGLAQWAGLVGGSDYFQIKNLFFFPFLNSSA